MAGIIEFLLIFSLHLHDLWFNVPAPTPSNHAHWSFLTPFPPPLPTGGRPSHCSVSRPGEACSADWVPPMPCHDSRRSSALGTACLCVCCIHPSILGRWAQVPVIAVGIQARWGWQWPSLAPSHGTHPGPPGFAFTQDRLCAVTGRSRRRDLLRALVRAVPSRLCLGHALQVS